MAKKKDLRPSFGDPSAHPITVPPATPDPNWVNHPGDQGTTAWSQGDLEEIRKTMSCGVITYQQAWDLLNQLHIPPDQWDTPRTSQWVTPLTESPAVIAPTLENGIAALPLLQGATSMEPPSPWVHEVRAFARDGATPPYVAALGFNSDGISSTWLSIPLAVAVEFKNPLNSHKSLARLTSWLIVRATYSDDVGMHLLSLPDDSDLEYIDFSDCENSNDARKLLWAACGNALLTAEDMDDVRSVTELGPQTELYRTLLARRFWVSQWASDEPFDFDSACIQAIAAARDEKNAPDLAKGRR